MKKELSPGMVIGMIAAVVVAIILGVVFMVRNDPASQGPHPPPRFDPGAKAAESHSAPGGVSLERGPNDPRPGAAKP